MKIQARPRFSLLHSALLLSLILLSACLPGTPASPTLVPTLDLTQVSVSAQGTVAAIAGENAPGQVSPAAPAQPTEASAPPVFQTTSEYWITYLLNHKLAAVDGTGVKTALLTNTPGFDYLPTWAPNGKALAFLRFDGSSRSDGKLNVLNPGNDTPRALDGARTYNHFAWTPDSQQLVATRGFMGSFEIYLVDYYSGQAVQIAKNAAEYPLVSPDGKSIAMLIATGANCDGKGCTSPNDLFLYDIASRQTTRLTGDAVPKINISWSPDGQQIAYHLANDPSELVEIIQPDGKPVGSKQQPPWWITGYVRSTDGAQFAYVDNFAGDGAAEIFVRPAAGGEARRVIRLEKTADAVANIDTLRWRPDGSGFVFNMWNKLYTVNSDGGGLRAFPQTLENVFFDVRPTADAYAPPPEPTAPPTWKLCPGGLDSRLDIGRRARVTTDPPTPNNVREGPGRGLRLVGQIEPGELIQVTGGPVCDNGLIWWEIRSLVSGLKGYTMEGDLKSYWLVPEP